MAAEGDEVPLSQSRFSIRSAASAAGKQQDGSSTPVSRRPSRSIPSEAPAPSPSKPTPSRGSLIPRRGTIAGSQREQNAGVSLSVSNGVRTTSCKHRLVCSGKREVEASYQLPRSAERVKVVVRVRPPRASETGGAIKVAPDHRGILLNREYALSPCLIAIIGPLP